MSLEDNDVIALLAAYGARKTSAERPNEQCDKDPEQRMRDRLPGLLCGVLGVCKDLRHPFVCGTLIEAGPRNDKLVKIGLVLACERTVVKRRGKDRRDLTMRQTTSVFALSNRSNSSTNMHSGQHCCPSRACWRERRRLLLLRQYRELRR
jgi:hypothetical protein